MQRRSLLDGDEYSGVGGRGGGGGGGAGLDKAKIAKLSLAGVLFLIAGGLLAWNYGLFEGRDPYAAPPPTKAEQARHEKLMEEEKEKAEQLEREGKITIGGA